MARDLISKVELIRVRLQKCNVSLEGEEEDLAKPICLAQSHNSTVGRLLDGILPIEVSFRFQGFDSSEGKVPLFSVACTFELDYRVPPDCPLQAESIEAFKNGNAVFNCWPYAREFVQSTVNRMGLSHLPPLPLLRVAPKPKQEESPTQADLITK